MNSIGKADHSLHLINRFVFPAIGGALFGYDIGATSGAVVSLKVRGLHPSSLQPAPSCAQCIKVVVVPLIAFYVLSLNSLIREVKATHSSSSRCCM